MKKLKIHINEYESKMSMPYEYDSYYGVTINEKEEISSFSDPREGIEIALNYLGIDYEITEKLHLFEGEREIQYIEDEIEELLRSYLERTEEMINDSRKHNRVNLAQGLEDVLFYYNQSIEYAEERIKEIREELSSKGD